MRVSVLHNHRPWQESKVKVAQGKKGLGKVCPPDVADSPRHCHGQHQRPKTVIVVHSGLSIVRCEGVMWKLDDLLIRLCFVRPVEIEGCLFRQSKDCIHIRLNVS